MKMPGTVTIDLKDYLDLVEHSHKTDTLRSNTSRAAKEMSVFLSFLCTRTDIMPYVEEFNRQSKTAKIVLQDDKATIEFNNDQDKI
tara:strand:- start:13 stop:270 length:258 start_codon:yes stop_codon:yes gene_type:complete